MRSVVNPLLIFTILTLCFNLKVQSQTVEFSYNDNGSRTERTLYVAKMKSATIFPSKGEEETIDLNNEITTEIKIYPNPVKDHLNVVLNGQGSTDILYQIFDLQGTIKLEIKNRKNNNSFSVSALSRGIYILRITSENKSTDYKIVKTY